MVGTFKSSKGKGKAKVAPDTFSNDSSGLFSLLNRTDHVKTAAVPPVHVKLQLPSINLGDVSLSWPRDATTMSFDEPEPIDTDTMFFAPLSVKGGRGGSPLSGSSSSNSVVCFNDTFNNGAVSTSAKLKNNRLNTASDQSGHIFRELASFEGEYPIKTSVCCWWCAFPFDGRPIGIPKKFKDNAWYCCGCFCSFSCALAFCHQRGWCGTLLKQMYYHCTKQSGLFAAPDPSLLDIFGGPLDIEHFRMKGQGNVHYLEFRYPQIPWPVVREDTSVGSVPKQHMIKKGSVGGPSVTGGSGSGGGRSSNGSRHPARPSPLQAMMTSFSKGN